jgi:hypothetical protein
MRTIWAPSTGYLEISVFRANGMELNGMKKGIARSFHLDSDAVSRLGKEYILMIKLYTGT